MRQERVGRWNRGSSAGSSACLHLPFLWSPARMWRVELAAELRGKRRGGGEQGETKHLLSEQMYTSQRGKFAVRDRQSVAGTDCSRSGTTEDPWLREPGDRTHLGRIEPISGIPKSRCNRAALHRSLGATRYFGIALLRSPSSRCTWPATSVFVKGHSSRFDECRIRR